MAGVFVGGSIGVTSALLDRLLLPASLIAFTRYTCNALNVTSVSVSVSVYVVSTLPVSSTWIIRA